ncbi:MAG: TonB-dependent receptor, partial [Myxococcota bacterium]
MGRWGYVGIVAAGWAAADARADCPTVPWPPGLDLGASIVTATLVVDADGAVADARDWTGPAPLIDAVRDAVPGCRLVGPATVGWAWTFPEPPVNVAGTVRSKGDRAPVGSTTVRIGERTARTDADGAFSLRNVAPGAWTVSIADPAWRLPADATVTVTADQRVEVALWVVPDRGAPNELVATYSRAGAVGVVRTVDVERARGIPGTLGDPLRALAGQPGLTRSPYDAGWLLVRGGDYDDVGLFLDGVRVPLVYHLGGFTSVLHPELVDTVKFWPGAFPARYGNAISGAVDLVPRTIGDRARVVGGLNVVFAHAYAETPTRWGGIAVAARRSWLDGVVALALGPESARIAPRFWDVSGQLRIGDARITLLGMSDAIDAPSFSGDGVLTIEQRAAQAQAVIPVGDAVTVRPWVAWTRRVVSGDVTPQSVDEVYPGLRVEGVTAPSASARITGGAEVQRRLFHLDRSDLVRDGAVWNLDPYAGLAVGDPVALWTEVRMLNAIVEADPAQPLRSAVSPRAGVRVPLTPGLAFDAEWGRLHQLPSPTLLLAIAEGVYLGLESSDQVSAGFRAATGTAAVDGSVWSRTSQNLAELELDGSVGQAVGKAYGFDAEFQFVRDGFDGSVLYQFTRALKREDIDDDWLPSPFDVPHRVELRVVQQLPRAIVASARFRFTSGYPRTLEGRELIPTEAYDLLTQRIVPLSFEPGQTRLDPFHALDLRVGRLFSFDRWQLELSLDVQNVYSRRVVEPVITGFGESRPSYGFGLPVLPIFAVDGKGFPRRRDDTGSP